MSNPTILAGEDIARNRCVRISLTEGIAFKADYNSAVGGVTALAVANGEAIQFQPGPFYLMTAGGTITSGDFLVPSVDGTVVTAPTIGQFIAIENSTSGKTVNARKAY